MSKSLKNKTKLNQFVSVTDFGVAGDGWAASWLAMYSHWLARYMGQYGQSVT